MSFWLTFPSTAPHTELDQPLIVPHLFCQPSNEAPVFMCAEGNPLFQSYITQLEQIVKSQYTKQICM